MKKIAIALLLCMVLSIITGSAVFAAGKAGAQRVPFYPVDFGSSDYVRNDLPAQGAAVINDPMGNVALMIQGNVNGLQPNHFYTVWVRELAGYTGDFLNSYTPLGYYLLDTFTTNEEGKGHFHLNIRAQDLSAGTYNIQVAINDAPSPDIIGVTVLATEKYTTVTIGN